MHISVATFALAFAAVTVGLAELAARWSEARRKRWKRDDYFKPILMRLEGGR